MIAVLIYFRPYEKRAENILAIYNAILYFFGIFFFFLMATLGRLLTEQQRYLYLGFPLIGILVLIIIANIGYGVFDSLINIAYLIKKVFKGKKSLNKVETDKTKEKEKTPKKKSRSG